MSDPNPLSPATASLHAEQARQRTGADPLQEGLEDTFPASDPVSHTTTATVGGAVAAEDDAPKVDEALEAMRTRDTTVSSAEAMDEIRAMRAELSRMSESAEGMVSASGRIVRDEAQSLSQSITRQVHKHPLQSLALAALAGYVWGMTR